MTAKKGLLATLARLLGPDDPETQVAVRGADRLARVVAESMPEADVDSVRVVTAVAGLLACVAYADQVLEPSEEARIREELSRIHGLAPAGADAIASLLTDQIAAVTSTGDHRWVRDLRDLADRATRVELLDVLVDLAAADDDLALAEVNYLRRLTTALGLEQPDYDAAQEKHRHKLRTLR